ncbi:4-hydroxy-tetrahydrodipicolinate synthase [Thalassomonas viridans]|uniref:4-hydroxy-tetrahydrodipicolinate synthase n=1 Tax=Thalassomonas viridans TaxID=137584 RepID=A0AAE9Z479_9GAMM|nr:4-hydroxy-tetrahydrodipicolinate synthase [Thalassomonas viridans]WDE04958.1 4-hydroxy-tetrahydrodipicolinate synthase [Thalassomonas viridans]
MNQIQVSNLSLNCPLWTALVTPFHANGAIDFASLETIARDQADAGNGILLLGSTGEGLALSGDEQLSIVEHICRLSLPVPLMVAVGGYDLAAQLEWINTCNRLPVHAYLLGSPLYAKPGPEGQYLWFSALLEQAAYPCMLYNVPSRSGINLDAETLARLQHFDNCWALKEASGELEQFLRYRQACPELALYSGEDAMMPYLASAGARGLVSVCANAWPEATRAYVELSLASENQGLFPLWQNAIAPLFAVANPVPVKQLMFEQQVLSSPALRPPLTHTELPDSGNLIQQDQLISQWQAQRQGQDARFS